MYNALEGKHTPKEPIIGEIRRGQNVKYKIIGH